MSVGRRPAVGGSWTVVHDFGFVLAGAERVSQALANEVLDGVPLITVAGDPEVLDRMSLRGGWRRLLPRWLAGERRYRLLAPLYPLLLSLRTPILGDVLCSSYAFAHHIRCTGRKVVYCHTPLRQVWSGQQSYLEHATAWQRGILRLSTRLLRRRDVQAAHSATTYVASSRAVQGRIEEYYGLRNVEVVAPPLDVTVFHPTQAQGERRYFLWVGRIVEPYKQLELTIDAFRGTEHVLLVAGDGRDRRRLEATAPQNVTFLGWQTDRQLAEYYRGAIAVVFPSEDDFGLVPVESMACGTPSVAFAGGGAKETVTPGVTGIFFSQQTPECLREALQRATRHVWDHQAIARAGGRYGLPRFVEEMRAVLDGALDDIAPEVVGATGAEGDHSREHQQHWS